MTPTGSPVRVCADVAAAARARRRGSSPAAAASAGAGCSRGLPSCPRRDCRSSSRRRRSSRMVSAMSPVTPKPAAEFSTLAMTKSIDVALDERGHRAARDLAPGLAEDVADEEDAHRVMSAPRRECGSRAPRRSSMRGRTTRSSPSRERRLGAAGVEGAVDATARANRPKARSARWNAASPCSHAAGSFLAGDEQRRCAKRRSRSTSRGTPGRSRTISMPVVGFDDVEGRGAFRRRRVGVQEPE